ncbi:DUF1289 domain-containing protein [Paracoccus sp. (in: a-proteobacteria)]|uniref:DUF1289 domain-containing protein n=1 Tax=Paracoccus sp. TaxID=267 RepID=UPI0028A030DB|nr:DUF1289 domain-containing protein [Paracoccus sp. (in: a-proteobacteria)]
MISPCINICQIGPHGFCIGCARNMDEIARWSTMPGPCRDRIIASLPQRRADMACRPDATATDQK